MPITFTPEQFTLVNGQWQNTIAVTDRGLSYGDGIFETLLYFNGSFPLFDFHLNRLKKSSDYLKLNLDVPFLTQCLTEFTDRLNSTPDLPTHLIVKITITRGAGGRGYIPPEVASPTIIIQCRNKMLTEPGGAIMQLCASTLGMNKQIAGHKHLSRLEYVLAGAELKPNVSEGLLVSSEGHMVEALHHNIYWVENNTIYTPCLTQCGVNGVFKQYLLEKVFPTLAMSVEEVKVKPSRLVYADEMFISNAVNGVRSVASVDNLKINKGVITDKIINFIKNEFGDAF